MDVEGSDYDRDDFKSVDEEKQEDV